MSVGGFHKSTVPQSNVNTVVLLVYASWRLFVSDERYSLIIMPLSRKHAMLPLKGRSIGLSLLGFEALMISSCSHVALQNVVRLVSNGRW